MDRRGFFVKFSWNGTGSRIQCLMQHSRIFFKFLKLLALLYRIDSPSCFSHRAHCSLFCSLATIHGQLFDVCIQGSECRSFGEFRKFSLCTPHCDKKNLIELGAVTDSFRVKSGVFHADLFWKWLRQTIHKLLIIRHQRSPFIYLTHKRVQRTN